MSFGELYLRNDGWDMNDTLVVVVAGTPKTVTLACEACEAYERYGQYYVIQFKGNTVIICK